MADPQIEKLLILQDRDIALQKIEQELTRIPQELAKIKALIETETANIEAAGQALKEKEVQRKELDSEVGVREANIARFKTQQLAVKKNEEYKALTHQIEQAEKEIGELEEQEIQLMLEIDETKEKFEADKADIQQRIELQKKEILLLAERETNLKASIDDAKTALANAREGIKETFIGHYDRVRKLIKRPPYLARIEAHKCAGCHLRVSNEVSKEAQNPSQPTFCDQCARMVYA